jgi:Fibronectin type III domain/Bacterial Ig domain
MRSNRTCCYTLVFCSLILLGGYHETRADSLHLTWSDSSQNHDGFEIERRSADSGVFSFIAIVPPYETWYSDYNLVQNTTYCYRVRAYNRAGASPYSNEFCATTLAADQTLKTISTNISNGAILSGSSVVWTAIPSGVPMRVEFLINGTVSSTELTSPYQFNGDPSGTLDTNALTNGSHQLKVRALYANNLTAERTVVVTVSNSSRNQH